CPDVITQRGKLRDGSAFDRRDALLGYPHGLSDLRLGQACLLTHLHQVLGPDLEHSLLTRILHSRAVVGVDELVQELIASVSEKLRLLAHRCSCQAAASSTGTHLGTAPAVSQSGSLTGTCSAVPGSSRTWRALLAVDRAAWLRCGGGRVGA